jgi:prepilin-type N-terminal cleavage/methylation domain-containing protein
MTRTENNKGFTIIEVVLVLAIAGLIFLMVFIAFPSLQAGQRDTARKSDVSNVAAAVSGFSGANRGLFPTTAQLGTQLNVTTTTPVTYTALSNNITSVTVVTTTVTAGTSVTVADGVIKVYKGSKCATAANTSGKTTLDPGTARGYATVTQLEGGNKSGYCLNT